MTPSVQPTTTSARNAPFPITITHQRKETLGNGMRAVYKGDMTNPYTTCTAANGRRPVTVGALRGATYHAVLLHSQGACPWCGACTPAMATTARQLVETVSAGR